MIADDSKRQDKSVFPQPTSFEGIITPLLGGYLFDELIKTIEGARLSIRAIQYQWKWNLHQRHSKIQRLGACLIRAKKRNVDIKIILHAESPKKHLTKINSLTHNELTREGCEVKMMRTASILHTKLWIVDGQLVIIGSHNISTRSLTVNEEASVKIKSKGTSKFFNEYFNNLWA